MLYCYNCYIKKNAAVKVSFPHCFSGTQNSMHWAIHKWPKNVLSHLSVGFYFLAATYNFCLKKIFLEVCSAQQNSSLQICVPVRDWWEHFIAILHPANILWQYSLMSKIGKMCNLSSSNTAPRLEISFIFYIY